jgi:hypothetical protein
VTDDQQRPTLAEWLAQSARRAQQEPGKQDTPEALLGRVFGYMGFEPAPTMRVDPPVDWAVYCDCHEDGRDHRIEKLETALGQAFRAVQRRTQQRDGLAQEAYEVDQTLGKALGYPVYGPEMDAPAGDVCTGEDTPATLAAAAAQQLRVLAFALKTACEWIETGSEPMVAVANMRKTLKENPVG